MKILFTLSMVIILSFSALAQPQKMSYQCVVRNASGTLMTNRSVGLRISILQGSTAGTVVYQETYNPNPQTNSNGLVSIEIGGGLVIIGSFSSINWADGLYFLKTETDPNGGTAYSIVGTSQLLSVPYALFSKTSETTSDAVRLTGDQTIAGHKTFTGTTTVPSPVNTTDATTKAYVDNALIGLGFIPNNFSGLMSDIDGNTYKTVRIGTQTWMAENLRVGRFTNGTVIPFVEDNAAWNSLPTPGYCWYNNDKGFYKTTYGALYNWYTVNTGILCPAGWHVPIEADWAILISFLGGTSISGGKLKAVGTAHWESPNTDATNETGFTALSGGNRTADGRFDLTGVICVLWSATGSSGRNAWSHAMYYNSGDVTFYDFDRSNGFSVRCIKDN